MKDTSMKTIGLTVAIITSLFIYSCITESDNSEEIDLVIENGYYQLVGDSANIHTYIITFDYYATGTTCYLQGYKIALNQTDSLFTYWDINKMVIPGNRYNITEKLRFSRRYLENPVIVLQGYSGSQFYPDPRLKESYKLVSMF